MVAQEVVDPSVFPEIDVREVLFDLGVDRLEQQAAKSDVTHHGATLRREAAAHQHDQG